MRAMVWITLILLLSCGGCLAQMSTVGTTAMGLPTTPGAIVSSPLTGPSPFTSLFSAATIPGAPVTTLAAPPLAQDPTIPGTSVSCSPLVAELSPSVMSVTSTTTTVSASPTASMSPVGATVANVMPGSPTVPMSSSTTLPAAVLAPAMPVLILGSVGGSTTGTTATALLPGASVPGSSCTSAPGNALTNGASLPLATPDVPLAPPPGAIQSPTADLDTTDTSISPAQTVMATPNTAACNESISMDLANPNMMAPANAAGAAAAPGVSRPSGC
jgi:hypothetical protein